MTYWRALADALEAHGIPRRRAQVVALIADGASHSEVADELDLAGRGQVWNHVDAYRDDLENAAWLVEHGPDV